MVFWCCQVCNHPDLFERREVRSPFHMHIEPYILPKLVYREGTVYCLCCMLEVFVLFRNYCLRIIFCIDYVLLLYLFSWCLFDGGKFCQIMQHNLRNSTALLSPNTLHFAAIGIVLTDNPSNYKEFIVTCNAKIHYIRPLMMKISSSIWWKYHHKFVIIIIKVSLQRLGFIGL